MPTTASADWPVRIVTSATDPRVQYQVTPRSCSCPAFRFHRRRDRAYRCKHMRQTFPPPPFYCATCGQAPAAPHGLECWTCINKRRGRAMQALLLAALDDVGLPE